MSRLESMKVTPQSVTVCIALPPRVHSLGLWNTSETWKVNVGTSSSNFSVPLQNSTIPLLEFEFTLIFVFTQLTHFFLNLFGLPVLAAQLLTGVLLGEVGLHRIIQPFGRDHMNPIFPFASQEILSTISMFGFTLFTFLSGVKLDLGLISKTRKKALFTGTLTLVVSVLAGAGTVAFLYFKWSLNAQDLVQLMVVTSMHSLTPSPEVACLLSDLKILNSELGRLALSSALVSDISSIALTSAAAWSQIMRHDPTGAAVDIVVMIGYTLFVWFVCRPIMFWMIRKTPEGEPVQDSYIFFILLLFLGSALLSNWCQLNVVIGPLILGFAVPNGPPLGSTLVNKLDFMVNKVFMPVFVTTAMMKVTIAEVPSAHTTAVIAAAVVTCVIFLSKFAASLMTPLWWEMPTRDAVALGLIMGNRGVVQIAAYTIAVDTQMLVSGVFTYMMFTVVLSVLTVPPLVRLLYDPKRKYAGYQKRSLVHCKPDSELRILACINRADNTPAIINLLDASCPTHDSPIGLSVLHHIELVGRMAPVLISHKIQTKTLSNYSYSENVILAFSHFQRDNEGAVSVQVFTAISPPQYMYDDICTLALDKATSLIILPFHRKWSRIDGSVDSESPSIRTLNCSVLETAPCSVAILVNRGHIKCTNSSVSPTEAYRVALIFLGGRDDREALTFAKRMVKDACISLTVIRLVQGTGDEDSCDKWEWVQDTEMLKEVRYNGAGYVSYVEELVEDGIQTTKKLRSLMDENEYDLFIVGRRYSMTSPQTMGLHQWSEFPELGVIGDLLSSTDSRCKSSVLVIQQQKQRHKHE